VLHERGALRCADRPDAAHGWIGTWLAGIARGIGRQDAIGGGKNASIEGALEEKMRMVLEESRRAVREREEMEFGEALRISSVVSRCRGGGKSVGGTRKTTCA
jgi:hypothetical protein